MSNELENLGGVKCHRAISNGPKPTHAPSRIVDQWGQKGMVISENKQTGETFAFRYEKNRLVLEVMGTQIYFSKSSRSKMFVDSREPKKRFTRDEIRAEIYRMLGDSSETDKAMTALEFGY